MTDPLAESGSIRVPGRICIAPTSVGTAYPHGGTHIGEVAGLRWLPGAEVSEVKDASLGGERTNIIMRCQNPELHIVLGSLSTTLQGLLERTAAGGVGGYDTGDDSYVAGGAGVLLLFSARYPTSQLSLVLYRAVPHWRESTELALEAGVDIGAAAVFKTMRRSSGGHYRMGLLASLSL